MKQVRKRSGKKEFLIKWKGLPQEENTWEPEEHMTNARGAVRDFYKAHPNAVRKTSLPSSSSPRNIPFTIPPNPPLPHLEDLLPLYTPHPRLFGWGDKQFDEHYQRKLDKLWYRWKSAREEAYSEEDWRRTVPAHIPVASRNAHVEGEQWIQPGRDYPPRWDIERGWVPGRICLGEWADPRLRLILVLLWTPAHSNPKDVSAFTGHGNWHSNKWNTIRIPRVLQQTKQTSEKFKNREY